MMPLLLFVSLSLFAQKLGRVGGSNIAIYGSFLSAILSIFSFLFNFDGVVNNFFFFKFFFTLTANLSFSFVFDSLTLSMLVVVNIVSFIVHLYSTEYMKNDPFLLSFLGFLSLFTFFMNLLVSADNFIFLLIGWEGVGICSFILISFWRTRLQAIKSAMKAVIVNKVGDMFIVFGISGLFIWSNSFSFSVISSFIKQVSLTYFSIFGISLTHIDVICIFFFIGICAKSAQIFFHTWLADAMEGPTPVSALIHAATMVTAGVFLFIRCSFIFEYSELTLTIATIVGISTIIFAGFSAMLQNDIKKIVAYSTCSQLGYMILACGLSGYQLALFHLFNHAFFKALLFLASGAIIHSSGEQDIRKMGSFIWMMPFTYFCFFISSLSLAGFPSFSGFFSKDSIMHLAFYKLYFSNLFLYILLIVGTILTVIYSGRLIYLVFFLPVNLFKIKIKKFHDFASNRKIFFGFFFLCVLSITSGYIFKEVFCGVGSDYFFNSIFLLPNHYYYDYIFVDSLIFKNLPFICFLIGSLYFIPFLKNYIYNIDFNYYFFSGEKSILKFFNKKFFFDEFYNYFLVWPIYKLCFYIFNLLEKCILLVIGPNGIFTFSFLFSKKLVFFIVSNSIAMYSFLINLFFMVLVFLGNLIFGSKDFTFIDYLFGLKDFYYVQTSLMLGDVDPVFLDEPTANLLMDKVLIFSDYASSPCATGNCPVDFEQSPCATGNCPPKATTTNNPCATGNCPPKATTDTSSYNIDPKLYKTWQEIFKQYIKYTEHKNINYFINSLYIDRPTSDLLRDRSIIFLNCTPLSGMKNCPINLDLFHCATGNCPPKATTDTSSYNIDPNLYKTWQEILKEYIKNSEHKNINNYNIFKFKLSYNIDPSLEWPKSFKEFHGTREYVNLINMLSKDDDYLAPIFMRQLLNKESVSPFENYLICLAESKHYLLKPFCVPVDPAFDDKYLAYVFNKWVLDPNSINSFEKFALCSRESLINDNVLCEYPEQFKKKK